MQTMSYIQHLAADILQRFGTDLSRVAVVFPNKRASLFLNEELARQAAMGHDEQPKPLWSPSYITISDLFRRHSDLKVADQILLVSKLYDVYVRCTGFETETLDRFFSWGVLLLADFDDLDKNMADAEKVFRVVKDLHELDDISYLSDEQRESLKHFFGNFTDGHQTMMQEKFLRLWSRLYDIYTTFREELRSDGLAYEGMLYRDVIERDDANFEYDTYCFVAFNMLQIVEQRLFTRLKNMDAAEGAVQPRALFYWDYDTYYLNEHHEAGHFIGEYLSRYPDALEGISHDSFHRGKSSITYLSAPTENLQARYVHDWLLENDRYKAGSRTAIVMCDERLLQTIIRSLPEEVSKVNITTGYPLSQSPVTTFIQQLMEMQTAGRITGTDKYRLSYVSKVLCHPYARFVSENAAGNHHFLVTHNRYYPSRDELAQAYIVTENAEGAEIVEQQEDIGLELLATDLDTITLTGHETLSYNVRMLIWLQNIIKRIAQTAAGLDELARESLFRCYQVLQRLLSLSLDDTLRVDMTTLHRLLMQIINVTTVPYHGEPIEGIQIMGVLETRCLDFDHLLVLSCNEGNMPKGVNDASFIPHSIRKAYGLTTVENKVGIYSYYFHRLLQRAGDVSLAYNSSTEGMNTGEMSRFMLQLMVESNIPIRRITLQTGHETHSVLPKRIEKDAAVQQRLAELIAPGRRVSPSSLGKYLRCPLFYYYQYVAGLYEQDDDDADDMDNVDFGLIFHRAAEIMYSDICDAQHVIHADVINATLKDASKLDRYIDQAFDEVLFKMKDGNNYRPQYTGLQLINRKVAVQFLRHTLEYDKRNTPFMVCGTELRKYTKIPVLINGKTQMVEIGGSIDRLDILGSKAVGYRMRVVDYKTGTNEPKPLVSVEDVFDPKNISKHSDYYLQTMLYAMIVRHDEEHNHYGFAVEPSLLYVQRCSRDGYSPVLVLGKTPVNDIGQYEDEFRTRLSQLISDIHNPELPFTPTQDVTRCETCTFRMMCGV